LTINIRPASAQDAPLILRFITELAIYERAEHEVLATVESIETSLFTDAASAHALICEIDGEPVGFAVYFFTYSTWLAKKGLYLEDIYVSPSARSVGAGKRLLQHVARVAVASGCGRFEWSVLDWNELALGFYRSVGAGPMDEWTRYRMDGDVLAAFGSAPPDTGG
jgi:GNAT superfamily N-acetyltransferase